MESYTEKLIHEEKLVFGDAAENIHKRAEADRASVEIHWATVRQGGGGEEGYWWARMARNALFLISNGEGGNLPFS